MNKKTKAEQFFILLLGCAACLVLLCTTGCGGGKSCEKIQINSIEEDGQSVKGISIPGCGGWFTSGKGCNSCLWSQSYKFSLGSFEIDTAETGEEGEILKDWFIGCDNRYYGSGCFGCGYQEKSCYNGLFYEDIDTWGLFYGSSDSEETMMGCVNGCFGCTSSARFGDELLKLFEIYEEIDE